MNKKLYLIELPSLSREAIYKIDDDDVIKWGGSVEELHNLWAARTAAEWLDEIKENSVLTEEIEKELFPYIFGGDE